MKTSWHIALSPIAYITFMVCVVQFQLGILSCSFSLLRSFSFFLWKKKENIIWICVLHFFSRVVSVCVPHTIFSENSTQQKQFWYFLSIFSCCLFAEHLSLKLPRDFLHRFPRSMKNITWNSFYFWNHRKIQIRFFEKKNRIEWKSRLENILLVSVKENFKKLE